MMTLCSLTVLCAFIVSSLVHAATSPANYSVQLLSSLAPAGWSAEDWAAAADTMIGKTRAHILSDLIEDLGIELQVTEESIRESIDADRKALGLNPLPPHSDQHRPGSKFREHLHSTNTEPKEGFAKYLPPGWTEEKLRSYTTEEWKELPEDVQESVLERLKWNLKLLMENPNPGYFAELPQDVSMNITAALHEALRQQLGVAPGVRVYKRQVAPLVQVITIQSYEEFGFFLCRTSYSNETAWESFLDQFETIFTSQLNRESTDYGTNMDLIPEDVQVLYGEDEVTLFEGATADDCRDRFMELRSQDFIPVGVDIGVVLMADEKSIQSLADFSFSNPAHVWAVDVTFHPDKQSYPAGYDGVFEVRSSALLHHLFVALGSGVMTPVDVWRLLQKKPEASEGEKKHDEL